MLIRQNKQNMTWDTEVLGLYHIHYQHIKQYTFSIFLWYISLCHIVWPLSRHFEIPWHFPDSLWQVAVTHIKQKVSLEFNSIDVLCYKNWLTPVCNACCKVESTMKTIPECHWGPTTAPLHSWTSPTVSLQTSSNHWREKTDEISGSLEHTCVHISNSTCTGAHLCTHQQQYL